MDVDSYNNKTAAGWPMAAGEMAQRVREHDWAATALGPVAQWPVSLRTTVETALAHPLPTIVLWGRELIQIYNDACRDFMGANHPASLGTPVRECRGEVCHVDAATCERVWQGKPVSLEQTLFPITRAGQRQDAWISRACSPVRDESGRVAGVLLTIVKAAPQQHMDAALRTTQARQAFLLRLSDALRPLQDAQAIKRQATRLLGEQLGVNRAFYAEVQGDDWIVVKGYEQGAVALPDGPYSARTFGDWIMATYRAGECLVFHDSGTDTRFSPEQCQAHAAVQILAAVGVPLIKEGTLVAILAVHSATPRRWSDDELALLEDAAERTWAAVERARAERALAASEAHLRAVLDALPVGVVIADTQGRLLQDNAAHRALWGVQPQATSGLQYGEQTGFWPETGQRIAAHEWAMARALRQGEVVRDELVQCQPFGDGARRFYLNNAAPVHDDAGQIVGGVVVEFDITQRLQAQEQLRLSQELFAAAFANNPAAIVLTRLDDGQVLDVNETWLAMTGERREAVLGQSASYMWPNDQDAQRFLAALHATGTVQGWEQAFRRRSGEVFVTQISAQLLTVHGERAILTTLVDITERKRSEEALRDSEERYRSLFERMDEGFCTIAVLFDDSGQPADYRFLSVNPAFEQQSGIQDAVGRRMREIAPQHERHWFQIYGQVALTGETIRFENEAAALQRWFDVQAFRVGQPEEHKVAVLFNDITARKQAEYQLRSLNAALEQRVQRRTAELVAARDAAETANRAKSAFLANMSHEIRTPMNAILGLAHLLAGENATPRQAAQLAKVEGAARHLLSIINDILDLSKIEAGKLRLDKRDFNLAALLEQVRSIVGASAVAKALAVEVDTGDVPAWLRGDDTRVRQALLNYAGNAVKFTAAGCITLRARREQARAAKLLVRFEVEDTGVGVDPQQAARLFEAFEQADISTTREHGGTGLGLTITRRLAELMGGCAGVRPRLGGGSVFWFTAWLEQGAEAPAQEAMHARADAALRQRHAGARVLVAEDHPVNREVALALLRAVALEVDFAENGAIAVEKAVHDHYDLVLMDMQMPVMDGVQAARSLRAMPHLQTLPILAMTANAFGEDRAACLAAGMNDFVSKPVEPQTLYATILKWLDRSPPVPVLANAAPPGAAPDTGTV